MHHLLEERVVDYKLFEEKVKQDKLVSELNKILEIENYKLIPKGKKRFKLIELPKELVGTITLTKLSHETIAEHLEKSKKRVAQGDYAGALTSAKSLVEGIMKKILLEGAARETSETDLKKLYREVKKLLDLSNGKETPKSIQKILSGLESIIGGLEDFRNHFADVHHNEKNVTAHQATLAVNSAFTLCEFLIEEWERKKNDLPPSFPTGKQDPTPLGELAKLLPELTHEQHMAIFGFAKDLQKAAEEEAKEQEALDAITYEARQKLKPMTWEELNERLKRAEENIASGNLLSEEDLDREMEKWEEEDDE